MDSGIPALPGPSKPKLLAQVRDFLRLKHYSLRTEEAYLGWIKRFILFHGKRHPNTLGADAIREFLTDLAVRGEVAASTQNQAFSALLFLYREVLGRDDLTHLLDGVTPAKRPHRVPVVFTRAEARQVLDNLVGMPRLMGQLLYGSGLRLMECLRLRVKDLDFGYSQLTVRDGKGQRERVVPLPQSLREPLNRHLEEVRLLHQRDLRGGFGAVYLPFALAHKYPDAPKEWAWQYVFPSPGFRSIPAAAPPGGTTWSKPSCNARSRRPSSGPGSPNTRAATPSGIRSRPICWRAATTSAPCRNCSATRT